jgi:hypothetical protein
VLEWTLQTAWKGLKILAEKLFSLLTTISRYILKALKLLYKATKFVAVHAARVFVKVVSFIQMVLFKLGDKLFDLTLDLIAYTARLLRFIAFLYYQTNSEVVMDCYQSSGKVRVATSN